MIFVPDANILIYAFQTQSPHHSLSRAWLEGTLNGKNDQLGLIELVEVALLRITTLPSLGDLAAVPSEVLEYWSYLSDHPNTRKLTTGVKHADIFKKLIRQHQLRGNDINDAWLAALVLEHEGTMVSADRGFERFDGLLLQNPL